MGVPVALVLYAAAVITPRCAVEVLGPGAAPLTLYVTVFAHTVRVRGFRTERVDPSSQSLPCGAQCLSLSRLLGAW